MCEESTPADPPLSDNDRLLLSADAVAARTKLATLNRLQRWSLSTGDVADANAALDKLQDIGTLQIDDVMSVMDTLLLDLVLMSMPLGFNPATANIGMMIPLSGWEKK
jgi:hypothetical protein